MLAHCYGNPHSDSSPSKLTGQRIEETRLCVLSFFRADPGEFDLIFTANATAGIKIVMEGFRDTAAAKLDDPGFWFGYHYESHTSLVGIREATKRACQRCFQSDEEVQKWIYEGRKVKPSSQLGLFAYPGQSNLTGRRLPWYWYGTLILI